MTTTIENLEQLETLLDDKRDLRVDGDCNILCDVPYNFELQKLNVGGTLDVRGYLDVRGEYFICKDLYWSQMSMPVLPDKHYIRRVYPREWQRAYWQERLGMKITGCYDDACKIIKPKLKSLLADEKWTPTERWMLETLADSEKPVPEWVGDVRSENEKAA